MSSQKLLLVDEKDHLIGYAGLEECHSGRGRRHRAFVTLLSDSSGNVFLQRRKHKIFDGLWDLTAISHPLHIDGRDETYQEASDRALKKEMGIGHVEVRRAGEFVYFAKDGKSCENEYCAVLVGSYDGDLMPVFEQTYEAKKMKFDDFTADISKNPKKYTPWAKLAVKKIQGQLLGSTSNFLQSELLKFLSIFDPYAAKYFESKIKSTKKYSPLISNFYKDLRDFSSGGKRLRAFLVYLGFKTGGGEDIGKILPICLAVEIFHNFLLIHDDVIDKSDMRRGKPTIHKKYGRFFGSFYGISQAILIGDIACVEGFKLINESDLNGEQKNIALQYANNLLETAYGEALDVEYSYRGADFGSIWKMTDLKTARYSFVGPLTLGGLVSGMSTFRIKALELFGLKAGIAFQLQDDILGIFGDEKKVGKSILSDMREGKNTLLICKAKELAKKSDRQIIEKIWGNINSDFSDLEKIREIIERSGARKWSRQESGKLIASALRSVKNITGDSKLGLIYNEIAEFVSGRDK